MSDPAVNPDSSTVYFSSHPIASRSTFSVFQLDMTVTKLLRSAVQPLMPNIIKVGHFLGRMTSRRCRRHLLRRIDQSRICDL